MPIADSGFMLRSLEFLATFFIFFIGLCALTVVVVYIIDISQTKHALRRNYPVIGHFRYFFEEMGKFFRQYFFAMDREEMPFKRVKACCKGAFQRRSKGWLLVEHGRRLFCLYSEFGELINNAGRQARKASMKRSDIKDTVAEVRGRR